MPETEDALLGGGLRLVQPASGHRAGTDAIMLAAACVPTGTQLGDFGAGIGTAGLAAAVRLRSQELVLAEQNVELAALAVRNISLNGLSDKARVVVCDLLAARARHQAGLDDSSLDDILCNPPWYEGRSSRISPHPGKAAAYTVEGGDISTGNIVEPWLRAASAVLRPGGSLTMIHRVERLGDLLAACEGRLGALAVLPLQARADAGAIRIIVRGIKGSRAPMTIAPALILHDAAGAFTAQAQAIHRGEAAIGWPG